MKSSHRLFLVLTSLVGLAVALVALAFVPAVQRWALLKAASGRRGVHLDLDYFWARPGSFTARGVRLEIDRTVIAADRLDGDISLLGLLTGSRLEIDRLAGFEVAVDATHASRNRLLAGIFAAPAGAVQSQLPWPVSIGELDLAGTARLPGSPGRPDVLATFKLTGGQIAPGHEGTLRLRAHLVDPMPGARVGALDLQAALQLKQSTGRSFDRFGITALVDASGPQISGGQQLKVAAELARLTDGETYRFHIDTLANGRATDILDARARRGAGPGNLSGDWTLTATSAQIEPFIIGGGLPDFEGKGHGTFRIDPGARAVAVEGALQGSAGELESLVPALRAVGTIKVDSRFDFSADAAQVRLTRLEVDVAGAQPFLQLHSAGPLILDLRTRQLHPWRLPTAAPAPSDNELARLRLTGLPAAWVGAFAPGMDFSGGINGELALVTVEGSRLSVRTVTPFRVAGLGVRRGGRTLLAKAGLSFDAVADGVAGALRIQSGAAQLSTPVGDSLSGRFTVMIPFGTGRGPLQLSGDFSGDVPGFAGRWFPGAHVRVQGGGDIAIENGRWEVRRANLDAMDDHGQRLLTVAAARPFAFFPGRQTVDGPVSEAPLVRVNLGQLPLSAWWHPSAPYQLGGFSLPDEFVIKGSGGKLTLSGVSPLRLSGVTFGRGSEKVLENLDIACAPVLDWADGKALRLSLGDVTARDASGAVAATLNAEVAGSWPELRAQTTFNLDLPALGAQPLFRRAETLSAGRAIGEFRAAILAGGALQIEARATVNGMVGRDGAKVLPVANLSLRTLTRLDGSFSVEVPVLIDSAGMRSDLKLTGEGTFRPSGSTFEARLTGDHVDLAALLALAGAGSDSSSPASVDQGLSPPAADAVPFWGAWAGHLELDVKELVRGREWSAGNLAGRVTVNADSFAVEKLTADLGGTGKFSAMAEVAFADRPEPYEGHARVVLSDFEAGKVFRGLDADAPPPFEGMGTLRGKWESTGLTLGDTWERLHGEIDYSSNGGVFRGLKRASDKISMASKAVEWSAALGSLLKTGKVKEAAEKVAGSGYYVDQLALAFGEFNYDQFSFHLSRDEAANLRLTNLSLVSPEIELQGTGDISAEAGKRWNDRPLHLSLSLGARGRVEQSLGRLKLLDGTRDAQDFARAKDSIVVGGTVAHPDALSYYLRLLTAKPVEPEEKKPAPDRPPGADPGSP